MDTRYLIFTGVLLAVAACGGAYTGVFAREGRLERRRYLRFIVIFLFLLPVIYSVMMTIQGIAQSNASPPPSGSYLKVLSQVPLFLGTMLYMILFISIAGGMLASPYTFILGLTLAPVSKWILKDGKPADAGVPRMLAMDGIAFTAGAIANGLMMGGVFDPGFVPPVEIKSLAISAVEAGITTVICNRIAAAWVRRPADSKAKDLSAATT